MKKFLALFFTLTILFAGVLSVSADGAGLSNFKASRSYTAGQFTDVTDQDWFAQYVASAYRFSLMNGTSATYFNAKGNVTVAETITLASRLHLIYNTGSSEFEASDPWYKVYVDYAKTNGITTKDYNDYNRPATRAEYASIIGASLPDGALTAINQIGDNAIPDVPSSRSYAPSVYRLYRAGVLTGSDSKGTFYPDSNIKRSEVAAIISRLADESQRKEFSLGGSSSSDAVDIANKCSPAVFYIEVYDQIGNVIGTGSGFFIDSEGTAVTNYHVIENGSGAAIKLSNGEIYTVEGIYDCSSEKDIALLKIQGSGFKYLEIETKTPAAGEKIYAIGSPYGLDNSISEGIISNPSRMIDDISYIQFTAPISSGSSGGAIINAAGKVIGISSASVVGDANSTVQNLNLAIPIGLINTINVNGSEDVLPMDSLFHPGNGWIYVENGSDQTVCVGSSTTTGIYFGGEDDYFVISCDFVEDSEMYVKTEWGEFDGNYIPLTIYGLNEGMALLRIDLYNESETNLLATEYVWVNVIDVSLTVSEPQPVVALGHSVPVTFYVDVGDYEGTFYLTCETENEDIVSVTWADDWTDDNTIDLSIKGLKAGTTKIYVDVMNDFDESMFGGYITVTVN